MLLQYRKPATAAEAAIRMKQNEQRLNEIRMVAQEFCMLYQENLQLKRDGETLRTAETLAAINEGRVVVNKLKPKLKEKKRTTSTTVTIKQAVKQMNKEEKMRLLRILKGEVNK